MGLAGKVSLLSQFLSENAKKISSKSNSFEL